MGTPRGQQSKLTNQEGRPLAPVIAAFIQEKGFARSAKTPLYYVDQLARCFYEGMQRQGVLTLEGVTPEALRSYVAEQLEATYVRGGRTIPLSRNSVNQRQRAAKTFLRWCVNQDYLLASPMDKVPSLKLAVPRRVGFTSDESRALVRESVNSPGFLGPRDRAVVLLLLGTGCRAGGLVPTKFTPEGGLTAAAFDWPRSRLLLTEKGAKDRWVQVGKVTGEAVKAYIKVRPSTTKTDRLFVNQRGDAFDYCGLSSMLGRLGKYAKIDGACTAHRFRHTYAAEFYQKHRDIMALMSNLGHTKVETTQIYLRSLGVEYGLNANLATPDSWLA